LDEAAGHSEINKASKTSHSFNSSASGLEGFATMSVLWMIGTSLDRLWVSGSVKAADGHAIGGGVPTLVKVS
jgi:D-hexose-6-phosphate mutarotase